jgi:MoaA/NifB/PqqE/SkfB family radical SAM enzyme
MSTAGNVHQVPVTSDLSFLWLEITGKCNLLCSHCYAESGPEVDLYGDMSHDDWMRVIDEAAELGCRSVQLIGGEPTMHPRLDDLVDHANHRGFGFIEVYTNATRLGEELLGCFQRSGVHVATSFYSDDPAVHEQVTRREGSWERTVRGIETVLAAGLPIRVGVIETGRNPGHGPRAIAFLKNLGVRNVRMDAERGVGRGSLGHPDTQGERYEELCGQCWKGRLCVTSSGEVFPCVFSRATRLGDVRSGLSVILQTMKLKDFRRTVRAMYEREPTVAATAVPGGADRPNPPSASGRLCNPDTCGPGSCNPAAGCNPDTCGPGSCNPASGNWPGSNEAGILVAAGELTLTNNTKAGNSTGPDGRVSP